MIPLYILGLLQRFGPQHGYQIKKIISEQMADFTQIKLPTIYYHLEKMESDGLLRAGRAKPGSRPEKTVYDITEQGKKDFQELLNGLLSFEYRPSFPSDAVFYFSDSLDRGHIQSHLEDDLRKLGEAIRSIQNHLRETLPFVPEPDQDMVRIIFDHHLRHYQAERDWAAEALNILRGE